MKDTHRTSTGIEIGSKYEKPLPQPTQEEELIQRALLHASGPDYVSLVVYVILLCVVCGLVFTFIWSDS